MHVSVESLMLWLHFQCYPLFSSVKITFHHLWGRGSLWKGVVLWEFTHFFSLTFQRGQEFWDITKYNTWQAIWDRANLLQNNGLNMIQTKIASYKTMKAIAFQPKLESTKAIAMNMWSPKQMSALEVQLN